MKEKIIVNSPIGGKLKLVTPTNMDSMEISPFSYYQNDFHQIFMPNEIVANPEEYMISEIEERLLSIINDLLYVTSSQLCQMLCFLGLHVEERKVENLLERMRQEQFVKKVEFYGEGCFDAYTLGARGVEWYELKDDKAKLQKYIQKMPTENIKMAIVTNQLFIDVMQVTNVSYEPLVGVFDKKLIKKKMIRPQAILKSNNEIYFVECTRRAPGWVEDFLEKMSRYKKVINSYENLNVELEKKPTLLFIAEDYEHMLELKRLSSGYKEIAKVFTYDQALFDDVYLAFYKTA